MELCRGSLKDYLEHFRSIIEEDRVAWSRDLCTGLGHLRKCLIMHRDLKPPNLCIQPCCQVRRHGCKPPTAWLQARCGVCGDLRVEHRCFLCKCFCCVWHNHRCAICERRTCSNCFDRHPCERSGLQKEVAHIRMLRPRYNCKEHHTISPSKNQTKT